MFRPEGGHKGLTKGQAPVGLGPGVEVAVGVQTGVAIGVSMTTVTGPVHGVKVVEVVHVPTYGMVIVVVSG
jgi:hypothetical protein